jgi:hypothetical protein
MTNVSSAQAVRLLRFARNDVGISVNAVIARSAQRDEAISPRGWDPTLQADVVIETLEHDAETWEAPPGRKSI